MRVWIMELHNKGWSTRRIAREIGITVPAVHQLAKCPDNLNCTGERCNLR